MEREAKVITEDIIEFIKSCLEEDQTSPRNQKHTAENIYNRLCEEKHFTGGASTIRKAVREVKEKMPEVYVPLAYDPGEAIQVD